MSNRKTFIIDTSVLLYDKCSIHSFPGNDVIIPLVVLDELDRFKDKKGLVGENARYINRYLDDLRLTGDLHKGIKIDNGQVIKVALEGFDNVPSGLDDNHADNKIISLAVTVKDNAQSEVILITKDINFRVKCDSLGIKSEDYYKDKINLEKEGAYKGYIDVELVSGDIIQKLYLGDNKEIIDDFLKICKAQHGRHPFENEFICLKFGSQSYLGVYKNKDIIKVKQVKEYSESFQFMGVMPKNREQLYAINALLDENIPLVTISGLAGSGKTFLALLSAYSEVEDKQSPYERIVITRNVQPVGRDIGFLPGDVNDKMGPWLAPIMDNFRHGLKDNNLAYFNTLRDKGVIEIAPLSFIRGRTFSNSIIIMDEAQNATIHELKTVITRIGENSKIILLGDVDQIDTPYIDELSNGLTIVAEKFKDHDCAAHITLKRGERSYLSSIAAKII